MRGLPHAHLIYRCEPKGNPHGQPSIAEEVDRLTVARYPDKDPATGDWKEDDKKYVDFIRKHQTHHCTEKCRPGGGAYTNVRCKSGFPFPLCPRTTLDEKGFWKYARPNPGDELVVPHNRAIIEEFGSHFCREISTGRKTVRYLTKYITKGPDQFVSRFSFSPDGDGKPVDEIANYQQQRVVTACEAAQRVLALKTYSLSPPVADLPVCGQDDQPVAFNPNAPKHVNEGKLASKFTNE
jgi:hypothetical protein